MFKSIDNLNRSGHFIRIMPEDTIRHQARRIDDLDDPSIECLSEIKACDLAFKINRSNALTE